MATKTARCARLSQKLQSKTLFIVSRHECLDSQKGTLGWTITRLKFLSTESETYRNDDYYFELVNFFEFQDTNYVVKSGDTEMK